MKHQKIPKWLSHYIQSNDIQAIETAVQNAELQTSGEIVPVIVKQSMTTGHVPLIVVLFLTTLYFSANLFQLQIDFGLEPWTIIVSNLLIGYLASWLISRTNLAKRWLTSKTDQLIQVEQRALVEFARQRIHHTQASTGILIFLSIAERRAIVLGDEGISKKLPPESWQAIVDTLTAGIKNRQTLKGLIEAIDLSGKHLREHFPRAADDIDELQNHLIIKE